MSTFLVESKNRIKRQPNRGHYDKATIYQIIDEAMICHVAFVQDGQPFVIPALHARKDDQLLIHGASTSRLLNHIQAGNVVSITITIVDGIVLAKTVFNQSVNYRSVVLFGKGRLIENEDEKWQSLAHLTEQLMPGVWQTARQPTTTELKATSLVSISIESASAKIRSGPPKDSGEDQMLPVWAGVLPVKQIIQTPSTADYTDPDMPIPDYVMAYMAEKNKDDAGSLPEPK
ncbi:MAG: pyridoxamine 5'-phosphate oxidase family protein [Ardenticatenaceae bacterium]|nr:pyridoxamine 5'-phosphate oxidase family protein [Anaerolineales bacterium]MCB8922688.1 pyridoxamine 5'-phosphate oxidase family protein [Ardenticatenaceae bacterium]MCB8991763.1 pyridoxamine 5'-phosphate oxidase family protein [Ardenticatenaceae bacterium]MCB9003604.1 pyridoxamine 5'-phosphate oxidase family protein [Ardenticatenaceae bacterium]